MIKNKNVREAWPIGKPKKISTLNIGDYRINRYLRTVQDKSHNSNRKVEAHISTVEFFYFKDGNQKFNQLREMQNNSVTQETSRIAVMESLDQNQRINQVTYAANNADYIYVLEGTPSYVLSESLKIIRGEYKLRQIFLLEWENVSNTNLVEHINHLVNISEGKKLDKVIPTSVYNQKTPNDILLAKIKKNDVSFEILSQKTKIPLSMVYKHAQDKADIDRDSATKYAKFFGIDPAEILFNDIQISLKGVVNFKNNGFEGGVISHYGRYEYVNCPRDIYRPDIQAIRIDSKGSVYDNNIFFYYQSFDGKLSPNQLCAFVFGDQTDNDIVVGRLFIDKYGSLSVRNPDITIIEEAFDEVKSKALGTGTGDSYYPHNINQPILSYEHSVHCSIRGQRLDHHYFNKNPKVKILPIISILNPSLTLKDEKRSLIIKNEEAWYKTSNAQSFIDEQKNKLNLNKSVTSKGGELKQIQKDIEVTKEKMLESKELLSKILNDYKDQSVWRKSDLSIQNEQGNWLNLEIKKYTDMVLDRLEKQREINNKLTDYSAKLFNDEKKAKREEINPKTEWIISPPAYESNILPEKMLEWIEKDPLKAKEYFSDKSPGTKIGLGESLGGNRAADAFNKAIEDTRLGNLADATEVILVVTGGNDVTLHEIDEIVNLLRKKINPESEIVFGALKDDNMEGGIRVSIAMSNKGQLKEDNLIKNTVSNFYTYKELGLRKEALRIALSSPALNDDIRKKAVDIISNKIPEIKKYKTAEIYPFKKVM